MANKKQVSVDRTVFIENLLVWKNLPSEFKAALIAMLAGTQIVLTVDGEPYSTVIKDSEFSCTERLEL